MNADMNPDTNADPNINAVYKALGWVIKNDTNSVHTYFTELNNIVILHMLAFEDYN